MSEKTQSFESFHDIQRRQRTRSWILLGLFCVLYFAILLCLIAAYRSLLMIFAPMKITRPDFGGDSWDATREALLMPRHYLAAFWLGVVAVWVQVGFARRHAVRGMLEALSAEEPDTSDRYHVRFRNTVAEMAIACGRADSVRAVVVPTHSLAAFGVDDDAGGAVVGVTEGLLSRLSRDQMQASVAQVMAHIREGDTRLISVMCAMLAPFVAVAEALEKASERDEKNSDDEGGAGVLLLLVGNLFALVAMLLYMLMRLVSTVFSRRRELLADANAVQYTRNPLALAQALHGITTRRHFMGAVAGAYSPLFIIDPTSSLLSEKQNFIANLFATHPPVQKRIDTLLTMAHAGPEALEADASILEGSDMVTDTEEAQAWLLRLKDGWSNAMPLEALLAHPDFRPDVWVTRSGAFAPVKAAENPVLAAALARSTSGQPDLRTREPAQEPSPEVPAETVAEMQSDPAPPEKGQPRPEPSGRCPVCNAGLFEEQYEGTGILRCRSCKGVLVNDHRIRRILNRREKAFGDGVHARVREWKDANPVRLESMLESDPERPLLCPDCGVAMARRFFSYQYIIVVDRCFSCAQTWFDNEELETLQVLVEEHGR